MNDDSRIAVYLSIMTLIFSCVGLGYGLLFFGWGPRIAADEVVISTKAIVVVGLVLAAMNGMASNILSTYIQEKLVSLQSKKIKLGIPLIVFLITLAISIVIALMNS